MKKIIKSNNSKPENILKKVINIQDKCKLIQNMLPKCLNDYFIYLNSSVSIQTKLAYLQDLKFFLEYTIEYNLIEKQDICDIDFKDLNKIKSKHVNRFLGDYCKNYEKIINDNIYIFTNENKSISRKKSSISVFFKFLYRENLISENISSGFNPIKLKKINSESIKKLEIDETQILLDIFDTGEGLTKSELKYFNKTKYRDKLIIYLFITYGLRITELQELNISSFNFNRKEFTIFRKRDKEVSMPFNNTIETILNEYLEFDRNLPKKISEKDADALFLSMKNNRLSIRAIRDLVKKYTSIVLNTSRNKGFSPHKLRATLASSLIEEGFSIYDVQNLLDHENVTTTQIYAAHKKNAKRDIIKNYELLDLNDKKKKT